jgi:hypothetical protein
MKGNAYLSTWGFDCSYIHILANTFEVNDNIVNILITNLLVFKVS